MYGKVESFTVLERWMSGPGREPPEKAYLLSLVGMKLDISNFVIWKHSFSVHILKLAYLGIRLY